MKTIDGVVLLAQEGRFQLLDGAGVGHLCVLSSGAAAEPAQLAPLQRRQARVRLHYKEMPNLVGLQVFRISARD